ncbi:MAG: HD-GYP domain-containing protein [bacterium]
MNKYSEFILDLLAQFGGGRGDIKNELARFGLGATLWGILFAASWMRRKRSPYREEKFIVWGFGIGFLREVFMFAVFSLVLLEIVSFDSLHIYFPPLEHALVMAAVIIIAGAYWRFILKDIDNSRRYIQTGIGASVLCFIATAFWWAPYVSTHPSIRFGETWADWAFRLATIAFLIVPIIFLLKKRSWAGNIVVISLAMFLSDELLMMINLVSGDVYKNIFGPIRHNLHLWAVIPLVYVYVKELVIERETAENKIIEENEISTALLKTFDILNSSLDIKQIVNNVIVVAPKYLKFDRLIIFLYGQGTNEIICSYSYGFDQEEKTLAEISFKNNGILAKLDAGHVIVNDINKYKLFSENFANALNIHDAVMMPIIISGKLEALLIGGYKNTRMISTYDLSFVKGLSNGVGIAMKNAVLFLELQQLLTNTITSFALVIDAKSHWTRGHTQRVTNYATSIGAKMGLNGDELETLWLGGLLHDIGKIGTPDTILDKSDKLTDAEFEIVKKHPVQGSSILASIKQFKNITSIIRHHHERYDGKGYPDGLKGKEIPLLARILCVADVYDAITEERPYRKAMNKEAAIEELKRCSGTQLDPQVVETFLQVI